MKIVFVETEEDERPFFAESLAGHDVEFVDSIDEVPRNAEIVSVFVTSRIGPGFLRSHPKLRLVASRSSAIDHLDVEAAARRKVTLVHVPDYGAATVAEHTFALILGVTRRLRHCFDAKHGTRGSSAALRGVELRGKTLGVVGTGRVGRLVIVIARGFGMRCIAFDRNRDRKLAKKLGFSYVTLSTLLRESDVITLHVPLTKGTRHMLNATRLARCKPGFVLINTARGALVDIDALLAGLDSGHVGGVGLDVLEEEAAFRADPTKFLGAQIVQKLHAMATPGGNPEFREERLRELRGFMRNRQLLAHENVFFTPHVGFNSVEAIERINLGTVQNIRDYLAGRLRPEALVR